MMLLVGKWVAVPITALCSAAVPLVVSTAAGDDGADEGVGASRSRAGATAAAAPHSQPSSPTHNPSSWSVMVVAAADALTLGHGVVLVVVV
mmetsp:Transcript_17899/g.45116  ORF Transcript_17899/g.45116 Transcript_17899/m.45116 type:complete len:91 (-) Transcript_17899:149-421(-)